MLNTFLNLLFPQSCPLCNSPSVNHKTAPICPLCWENITPYNGPLCNRCGRPLVSDKSIICGECITDEPFFKHTKYYGLYEGGLKEAIKLLKYHGIKRLSGPLSDLFFQLQLPSVDVIIPVPLYEKGLRERGFNQSALLARHLSKRLKIPVVINSLIKNRDTQPQATLNAEERKRNVRGAFIVKNEEAIYKKDIMLIDDVLTTGATIMECSKVLKKAGAGDIYVITLAHSFID